MGQSIGDLFVKLGFDVDDSKLKSFDESIKGVLKTALELAGIGGGIAGFTAIMDNAATTAVSLDNLAQSYGYASQSAREYISILQQANPNLSADQAMASYKHIAEYLKNIQLGGSAYALNALGIQYDDKLDPLAVLLKGQANFRNTLQHSGFSKGVISGFIDEITGAVNAVNLFGKSAEEINVMLAKGIVDQKTEDDLRDYAKNLKDLGIEWNKFMTIVTGSVAGGINELIKNIKENGWGAGVWKSVGELGAADPYHLTENGKAIIQGAVYNPVMNSAVKAIGGAGEAELDSKAFWESHGYTEAQVAAWLAQEQAESSFGADKNMNKGKYKGAFQWSPERAATIKKYTGIDIGNSSHWQQLQAADWEFHHMNLDTYFPRTDSNKASHYLSKNFEIHENWNKQHGDEAAYRAKLADGINKTFEQNVTINVQGASDPHLTAQVVSDTIQKHWAWAGAQLDQGSRF